MNTEVVKLEKSNAQQPTVLVSGGSRGLGATLVQACLDQGYNVATFSRSETENVKELQGRENYFWQPLDCVNYTELNNFVKETHQRFGSIDCLINNAAIGTEGILATMSIRDIDAVLDTNLRSQIYLTKLVVRKMLKARSGCIINISSINAVRGHSGVSVYSSTKAAIDGMTRSLAKELGSKDIRVNSISPGYFESDMVKDLPETTLNRIKRRTPLNRLGNVVEIAKLALFLFEEGKFITGQNIAIDGGFTC